jgi:hypothetical protein
MTLLRSERDSGLIEIESDIAKGRGQKGKN